MAGEKVTVGMNGGAPWGFRLYGGEADPLLVAKIRKRSKAYEAGLRENDVLLGINGVGCYSMNHGTAMGLVDSTGQTLSMLVLRGVNDPAVIESVLKEYVSKLKPVQPSSFSKPAAPPSVSQPLQPLSNGHHFGGALQNKLHNQQVRREEQTLQEGNTTRHITTETRTEQFGGTTLTKVTREEVSRTADRRPVFPVEPPQPVQRPGTWQPKRVVAAPSGVAVQHNPDRSVTMTIGFSGDKENVAPPSSQSMFRVSKVTTESSPAVWQPSSAPSQPPRQFQPAPMPQDQMDYHQAMQPLTCDTGDMSAELTAHVLRRILYDGSGSDECHTPDSPFGRKKKIFADSSFYDDPEHKYPTIEEQIKMARKVALSLMSPANVTARGHKMFIKRRQKSQKWTTDEFGHLQETTPEYFTFEPESEEEEKYYNPNPWRPVHTWQPPSHMSPQTTYARPTSLVKTAPPPPPPPCCIPAPPPPPPPVPSGTGVWKPDTSNYVDTNKRIMTQNEAEKIRMFGQKTSHTGVSPQTCFSLAKDLRNMKGKGGKLFAKRRARVDKWVVDESSVPPTAPTPELIKKLTGGMVPPPADVAPPKSGPRLQQMLEMPKPAMTPWEAAQSGDVDKAFDHIDSYERQVALANMGVPPAALSTSAFSSAPSSSASSGNARLPDGVRKIQGWGGPGNNLLSSASNSTQSVGSAPIAASPQPVTSSVPGFRPVTFNAGKGLGDFSPSQAGICDL